MQRIAADRIFETSDLYLAAYLSTRGHRLWATDSHNPERIVFVLTPRPDADDLAAYLEGRATVRVDEFGRALRELKRALWRAKQGRDGFTMD